MTGIEPLELRDFHLGEQDSTGYELVAEKGSQRVFWIDGFASPGTAAPPNQNNVGTTVSRSRTGIFPKERTRRGRAQSGKRCSPQETPTIEESRFGIHGMLKREPILGHRDLGICFRSTLNLPW